MYCLVAWGRGGYGLHWLAQLEVTVKQKGALALGLVGNSLCPVGVHTEQCGSQYCLGLLRLNGYGLVCLGCCLL